MKDCLDTIRHLQTAVLVLAAALLALALTPNDAARYDGALKTLRAMPRLRRDPVLEAARVQNQAAYKEFFARVDTAAHGVGTAVTFGDEPGGHGSIRPRKRVEFFEERFLAAQAGDTLEDEVQFYRGIRERLRSLPEPEQVTKLLTDEQQARPTRQWQFSGYSTDIWRIQLFWHFASDRLPQEIAYLDPVPHTFHGSATPTSDRMNAELLRTVFPEVDVPSFSDFHGDRRNAALQRITSLTELDKEGLAEVWEDLRDLSRAEAIKEAGERSRSATRSLSLVGVDIDERLATFGGPLALWLALLYLLLHIVHLRRLAEADDSLLKTYPWPPLFAGWAGAASSAVLLILFPTAAVVRFARRVAEGLAYGDDPRRLAYVGALAAAVGLTGLAAHATARRLPRAAMPESAFWSSDLVARWRHWSPFRPTVAVVDVPLPRTLRFVLLEWLIGYVLLLFIVTIGPLVFGGWTFAEWANQIAQNLVAATRYSIGFALLFALLIVFGALVLRLSARIVRVPRQAFAQYVHTLLRVNAAEPVLAVLLTLALTLIAPIVTLVLLIPLLFVARVGYLLRSGSAVRALYGELPLWQRMLAGILPIAALEIADVYVVFSAVIWIMSFFEL